jgi:hypothetical protein
VASPPAPSRGDVLTAPTRHNDPAAYRETRRRNWIAIGIASVLMMVSVFAYAAAFVDETGDTDEIEPTLVAIALAIAPFVFIVVAFVSRNPRAPMHVLRAMLLLLGIGLAIGLIDPVLGAATGFCAGGAVTLRRPEVARVITWRIAAIGFISVYLLVLFVVAAPAAVFTSAVIPLVMIGFADEYAAWSDRSTD